MSVFRASLIVTALAIAATACSQKPQPIVPLSTAPPPAASAIPVADRPPFVLVDLGQSAKALFDAGDAADWSAAADDVRDLEQSASSLPNDLHPGDAVQRLHARIADVHQSVDAHQRVATLDYANGITHIAADLAAQFHTAMPYEAFMLGYYGRQLQLGIASGQQATLTRARTDLKSTWNTLEPQVEQRGRLDDARRFTDIVATLDGARRTADFVAPTRAALAEADRIQHLF